jgi:hypothetical protein
VQPVAEEQEAVVHGEDDVRHQAWFELCGQ